MRTSFLRVVGATALVSTAMLVAGCSRTEGDRTVVHATSGQVLLDGQPISNALVVLHPKNNTDQRVLPARAQTDAEGRFQLSTYESGDGAAEGEFAVTVEHYTPRKDGDAVVPGPNTLPPRYSKPNTTDLTVRIAVGENQLEPLRLKRR